MAGQVIHDHVYDVVVLGTGAAGMTAAVRAAADGARVGLFERADMVGGTSAWSGGVAWLPNNRHEAEAGFQDSRDDVLTYLESLSHGLIERPMIEAFADTAPEVVDWLEAHTPVEFETLAGMSDYHPEQPGGRREGRSVECPLFPFDELAEWAGQVTVGWQLTGEFCMSESSLGRKAPNGLPSEELARRKIRDERGAGQALVGRLLRGCLDHGVVPQTGCRGVRLLVEDGEVVGAEVEGPDGPFEARAGGGVVLATGGFEHDAKLVRTFLRGPLERAVSVPTNTGDALRMAMRIGADLADMREAWWVATIDVEIPDRGLVPWQVNSERTRPHSIMVNDDGVRFTNEAANYNALGNAFHVVDVARFAYVNHPAWLLLDHHFLAQYGLARHRPPAPTPGWLIEAARSPSSRTGSACRWAPCGPPCIGGTPTPRPAPILISTAEKVTMTERGAIPRSATPRRRRSVRWIPRRTTRRGSAAERWARRAGRAPMSTAGSWTWTARSSTGSTRPATRWGRSWA